jgi:hypothetical protein
VYSNRNGLCISLQIAVPCVPNTSLVCVLILHSFFLLRRDYISSLGECRNIRKAQDSAEGGQGRCFKGRGQVSCCGFPLHSSLFVHVNRRLCFTRSYPMVTWVSGSLPFPFTTTFSRHVTSKKSLASSLDDFSQHSADKPRAGEKWLINLWTWVCANMI